MPMSQSQSSWALGHLSNRQEVVYERQNILVKDSDGRLRFTRFTRLDSESTLPNEILALIFLHCLPDDEFVTPSLTTAPLLLCGVCSRWKEVALSIRELWSSLSLVFPATWERRKEAGETADFYRMWLSRARAAPLSLLVEDVALSDSDTRASLLKIFVALSQQWQNVELRLREGLLSLLPVDGKYPFLEKLSLTTPRTVDAQISFRDAPKLRALSLSPYTTQIQFPWHQITSFSTRILVPTPSFLETLNHASSLVDAKFDIAQSKFSIVQYLPYLTQTPVLLPHLQSLNLTGERADSRDPHMLLLHYLKVPSLKKLTLLVPHRSTNNTDITPFLSFVSRSSFQLHTLVLSHMPDKTDLLIQCLKATPSVVHLRLRPRQLDTNTMGSFTGHRDFLPKLESFHIVAGYLFGATGTLTTRVVDMLFWRWAAVGITRLQSFRLAFSAKTVPDLGRTLSSHPKFQRLKEQGMVLYVGKMTLADSEPFS